MANQNGKISHPLNLVVTRHCICACGCKRAPVKGPEGFPPICKDCLFPQVISTPEGVTKRCNRELERCGPKWGSEHVWETIGVIEQEGTPPMCTLTCRKCATLHTFAMLPNQAWLLHFVGPFGEAAHETQPA